MNTTRLEYWRTHQSLINKDQHPGCHTHASGFDYVAWYSEDDERIDEIWQRELKEARQRLVTLLRSKGCNVLWRQKGVK